MKQNSAHLYREIAKKIVNKLKLNISKSLEARDLSDPNFNLEHALIEAMRIADQEGAARMEVYYKELMKTFDSENGESQN